MGRYVNYLISDVRLSTENEDFSDTVGISDSEFLRYINDAQFRIHNLIIQKHPSVFLAESVQSIVGRQEAYSVPTNTYMGNKVSQVEFSSNTNGNDWFYPLRPGSLFERDAGSRGNPLKYIRKAGQVMLLPVPESSTGQLKITYTYRLPKLDQRRGSIAAVTLDTSALSITTLTMDVSTDSVDATALGKDTRLTVCDEEGNVKMQNIKYTSVNASTGEVVIDSAFVYESGETIEVGDYVTVGEYSNTHIQLDPMVERYLIAYATLKILQRDSNITDLQVQQAILQEMEAEIIGAYAEISDDIMEIPMIVSEDDQWDW